MVEEIIVPDNGDKDELCVCGRNIFLGVDCGHCKDGICHFKGYCNWKLCWSILRHNKRKRGYPYSR